MERSFFTYKHSRTTRVVIVGFLLLGLVTLFSFHFKIHKNDTVAKLAVVAELAEHTVGAALKTGQVELIERELVDLTESYLLGGTELYSSDGGVLVRYGTAAGRAPTSIMLGEHLVVCWPHLLTVQYSRILFQGDRPLGLLIFYQTMGIAVLESLVVLGIFFLLALQFARRWGTVAVQAAEVSTSKTESSRENRHDEDAKVELAVQQRTAELEKERNQALSSAQAKGDFLANMSHEIRTTMNGVVGVLSLLQESGFSGERKRLLNVAARSADSLLLIINDILDFSKIESGKMEFEKTEFDLRSVVEESISLYIDTARSKGIRLHCYMPLEIAPQVVGDPTRLRQVVTNLLSNGVKFTDQGEVCLRVKVLRASEKSQVLLFAIEDTGIGVEAEKLDTLFDMFTQAESDTTRKYGGTGLGLNLCKRLVELQGGEIGVDSKPGQGTTFWFTMPFAKAAVDEAQPSFAALSGKKIALFDDCETCSTVILQYLQGCEVRSRRGVNLDNIVACLRRWDEAGEWFDILLVNYAAIDGEIDGLLRELIRLYDHHGPELFVLSRDGTVEERLKRKGVSGVVFKPIRLLQLHEEILGGMPTEEIGTVIRIEKGSARVLLVDDEHINRHVGQLMLEKVGFTVDTAAGGDEAVVKTGERRYDAVLMDIQMPGIDGLETTRIIRRRERRSGGNIPILAMTANALPIMKERCLEVGMNGFLTKPIKPEILLQHLLPYLADTSAAAETRAAPGQTEKEELAAKPGETRGDELSDPAAVDVWNRKLALEYLGGDEELLMNLAEMFLVRRKALIDAIEDSMRKGDGEATSSAAHAFKGAVNHFAAGPCQKLALFIEHRSGQGRLEGLDKEFDKLKMAADILAEELENEIG